MTEYKRDCKNAIKLLNWMHEQGMEPMVGAGACAIALGGLCNNLATLDAHCAQAKVACRNIQTDRLNKAMAKTAPARKKKRVK